MVLRVNTTSDGGRLSRRRSGTISLYLFFSVLRKAVNSADDEVVLIGKDKVGSRKATPVLDEIDSQEAAPSPVWSPPPT